MIDQQTKTHSPERHPPVMSAEAFAHWGVGQIAYIKPVVVDGQPLAAIFSADGQQIGLTATRDVARAATIQHSLEPVSVH